MPRRADARVFSRRRRITQNAPADIIEGVCS